MPLINSFIRLEREGRRPLFYFSTMTAGVKGETFPFKRSFSIIKCFSRHGGARQLPPTSLRFNPPSLVLARFSTTAVKTSCFPLSLSFLLVYPRNRESEIATPRGKEKLTTKRFDEQPSFSFLSNSTPSLSLCFTLFPLPTASFLYIYLHAHTHTCIHIDDVCSLVTENVATNELKRNFEEGRKRCHFHPRYSTISDMEDLRDGSRNRLWSGNVTPPPDLSLTPLTYIHIYISSSKIFVPFRFTRGRRGQNDPIIARKHGPSPPPLFSNVFDFLRNQSICFAKENDLDDHFVRCYRIYL